MIENLFNADFPAPRSMPAAQRFAKAEERDPDGARGTDLAQAIHRSPRLLAQRRLNDAVNNSPRVLAQRRFNTAIERSPRMLAQRRAGAPRPEPAMNATANTASGGLPAPLKSGIERLSGYSMDRVQVHYNSPRPAQLQALAYAQGMHIYVGPGQQRHLPHEAWHIVQQQQGRVRPSLQAKGMPVNDDPSLEQEADRMGARAMDAGQAAAQAPQLKAMGTLGAADPVMQAFWLRQNSGVRWINQANKVDAVLQENTPEQEQQARLEDAEKGNTADSANLQKNAAEQVYRMADRIEVPWAAIQQLVGVLGAAKVQAMYLTQAPPWGTPEGVNAIKAHLENFAKLDLYVLTALFEQNAGAVESFLNKTDKRDFGRIFTGDRATQMELVASGRYASVSLPPLSEEAAAPEGGATATASGDAGQGQSQTGETGEASDAAAGETASPQARVKAVRDAVTYFVSAKLPPLKGNWVESLASDQAQKWSAGQIAANVEEANADQSHSAGVLNTLRLPGVEGAGIFTGVESRVAEAVTQGPYETDDIETKKRPATATLSGDYIDLGGRHFPRAIGGNFTGNVSGEIAGAGEQPLTAATSSGSGSAVAEVRAQPTPKGQLQGGMSAHLLFNRAFASLKSGPATFDGMGRLYTRMDGKLHSPDTHWPPQAGAAIERQIVTDGDGNRAVLNRAMLQGDQGTRPIQANMAGSAVGWNHPVHNGGRYANLQVRISPTLAAAPGIFRPDNLHQIVNHSAAAGRPVRYTRLPDGSGPQHFDGALLASALTLTGNTARLQQDKMLAEPVARLLAQQVGISKPMVNDATRGKDISYAGAPQTGVLYSMTVERKKYEFKLQALAMPSGWNGVSFTLGYTLGDQPLARYLPNKESAQ